MAKKDIYTIAIQYDGLNPEPWVWKVAPKISKRVQDEIGHGGRKSGLGQISQGWEAIGSSETKESAKASAEKYIMSKGDAEQYDFDASTGSVVVPGEAPSV